MMVKTVGVNSGRERWRRVVFPSVFRSEGVGDGRGGEVSASTPPSAECISVTSNMASSHYVDLECSISLVRVGVLKP